MRRRGRPWAPCVLIAFVAGAHPALAQQAAAPVPCTGEVVTEVVIRSHAPTYGGLFARSVFLGRLVTSMHVATAPSVIRHFVLLKTGDRCTITLRRETERVLRAQPFLADARVTAYPDGAGRVRIEVVTVDEPSVIGSIGLRNESPYVRALTFGNANVDGRGVYAVAGWREGEFYRDAYWLRYTNHQLFRKPYQLQINVQRETHGFGVLTSMSRPFFTELQPWAWRISGGGSWDLLPFRTPGRPRISLGLRRSFFDLGGGFRLGQAGNLGLLGLSLSTERLKPAAAPVIVTDSGLLADTTGALIGRYTADRSTRLNLFGGYRRVNFLRVTGFDALAGTQDVRRGIEVGTTVGRGLQALGSTHDEWFIAGDIYGGVGSAKTFAAVELRGEGRRDAGEDDWAGVLVSGRLATYLKPHRRHTIIGSLEAAAGWRQRVPFQLSLGDARGGVRGYGDATLGGAQRVVLRLEERWRVGTIRGTSDAGVAFFGDVGRLWAGDAPLGRNTRYEPALGVGLLAAVPPGSQRMIRLDLAVPINRDGGAKWELRFSSADLTRAFYIAPNDVRNNQDRAVPTKVFTWP